MTTDTRENYHTWLTCVFLRIDAHCTYNANERTHLCLLYVYVCGLCSFNELKQVLRFFFGFSQWSKFSHIGATSFKGADLQTGEVFNGAIY